MMSLLLLYSFCGFVISAPLLLLFDHNTPVIKPPVIGAGGGNNSDIRKQSLASTLIAVSTLETLSKTMNSKSVSREKDYRKYC